MTSKHVLYIVAAVVVSIAAASSQTNAQTLSSLSTLLATPDGTQHTVAELGQGKVTIVSFWATWCKPCKEEMKAIHERYQELTDNDIVYIAISIDNTKTTAKVGPYIAAKGYQFPVLLDPNKDVFLALNGTDVPYTLVFNANGDLVAKHDGYLEGDDAKLIEEARGLSGTSASGTQ